MRGHVLDDAPNVMIGGRVEDILALPLGPQYARSAQQAEMVTDQGGGKTRPFGKVADADRAREAGSDDAQAARIAHEAEHLRELDRRVIIDRYAIHHRQYML